MALHACRNFTVMERPIFRKETGHWASCLYCAKLILADDWSKLGSRVMKEVKKRKGVRPDDVPGLRKELRALYKILAEHLIDGSVMTVQTTPTVSRSVIV